MDQGDVDTGHKPGLSSDERKELGSLLDGQNWHTRAELASAIFVWIDAFYDPIHRHSAFGYLSPLKHERRQTAAGAAA
jgi:putative transposase